MTNALTIFNQLRPHTIGYDNIFDHFNDMFENNSRLLTQNYPPYDIVKHSDTRYDIQVALAGYTKDDIEVELKEDTLSIRTKDKDDPEHLDQKAEVLHRGISKRYFDRNFTIAEDVKVNNAELKDGLLIVSLERVIPEHKKPRLIKIK